MRPTRIFRFSTHTRQRGMSLLEVLIAVLIMAIGILGIASLQAMALKNNQGSMERTQAVIQTYSIMDAMRANRGAALQGLYRLPQTCDAPASAETRVEEEQRFWLQELEAFHPDACGVITSLGGGRYEIQVRWPDRGNGGEIQVITTTGGV